MSGLTTGAVNSGDSTWAQPKPFTADRGFFNAIGTESTPGMSGTYASNAKEGFVSASSFEATVGTGWGSKIDREISSTGERLHMPLAGNEHAVAEALGSPSMSARSTESVSRIATVLEDLNARLVQQAVDNLKQALIITGLYSRMSSALACGIGWIGERLKVETGLRQEFDLEKRVGAEVVLILVILARRWFLGQLTHPPWKTTTCKHRSPGPQTPFRHEPAHPRHGPACPRSLPFLYWARVFLIEPLIPTSRPYDWIVYSFDSWAQHSFNFLLSTMTPPVMFQLQAPLVAALVASPSFTALPPTSAWKKPFHYLVLTIDTISVPCLAGLSTTVDFIESVASSLMGDSLDGGGSSSYRLRRLPTGTLHGARLGSDVEGSEQWRQASNHRCHDERKVWTRNDEGDTRHWSYPRRLCVAEFTVGIYLNGPADVRCINTVIASVLPKLQQRSDWDPLLYQHHRWEWYWCASALLVNCNHFNPHVDLKELENATCPVQSSPEVVAERSDALLVMCAMGVAAAIQTRTIISTDFLMAKVGCDVLESAQSMYRGFGVHFLEVDCLYAEPKVLPIRAFANTRAEADRMAATVFSICSSLPALHARLEKSKRKSTLAPPPFLVSVWSPKSLQTTAHLALNDLKKPEPPMPEIAGSSRVGLRSPLHPHRRLMRFGYTVEPLEAYSRGLQRMFGGRIAFGVNTFAKVSCTMPPFLHRVWKHKLSPTPSLTFGLNPSRQSFLAIPDWQVALSKLKD
ncbi:hypothetical protein FA13DRAFT_1714405 [Coprinellus micaceus]|uniref:Uncharacterized protein n=1 Tax=Coprinellus micaceus TaxID=71717 RepID=A0A4Y7SSR4_COPMI|nr:hypothetical protein FA13DRAFT_1714405 [Coprinellus micaceus]